MSLVLSQCRVVLSQTKLGVVRPKDLCPIEAPSCRLGPLFRAWRTPLCGLETLLWARVAISGTVERKGCSALEEVRVIRTAVGDGLCDATNTLAIDRGTIPGFGTTEVNVDPNETQTQSRRLRLG
jgi:hypothetical protein